MPPELMRFLESMRSRGLAGESRQMSGMYEERTALEEYEAELSRQAATKSQQQSRRKAKGSWGGALGGLAGLAILSAVTAATGGLATAPTLALMAAAGTGAAAGTVVGGARGGRLRGAGVSDIRGLATPKGAFKRFEGERIRGKEALEDVNIQLGAGREMFKSSITSNALDAALSAYLGAGQIRAADVGIRGFGQSAKQLGWGGAVKNLFKGPAATAVTIDPNKVNVTGAAKGFPFDYLSALTSQYPHY